MRPQVDSGLFPMSSAVRGNRRQVGGADPVAGVHGSLIPDKEPLKARDNHARDTVRDIRLHVASVGHPAEAPQGDIGPIKPPIADLVAPNLALPAHPG